MIRRLYKRVCEWLDRSEWMDKLPWGGKYLISKEKYDSTGIRLDRATKFLCLIGFCIIFPLFVITGYMFPTLMTKAGNYYVEGLFYQGSIPYFLYLLFYIGFVVSYLIWIICGILSFFFFVRANRDIFVFYIICVTGVILGFIYCFLRYGKQ
jgi:hypothetical protein